MEDLYAFLNIEPNASEAEISMVYHDRLITLEETKHVLPEEQDKQMVLLRKVKDVLLNNEERENYDLLYAAWQRKLRNITYFISDQKPAILYFDVDKRHFQIGDEITVTWKTTGCDQVILRPFGPVLNIGEKKIAFQTEQDVDMKLDLIATNTINGLMQSVSIHLNVERNTLIKEKMDDSNVHGVGDQPSLRKEERKISSEGIQNEPKSRETILELGDKGSVGIKIRMFFKSLFKQ